MKTRQNKAAITANERQVWQWLRKASGNKSILLSDIEAWGSGKESLTLHRQLCQLRQPGEPELAIVAYTAHRTIEEALSSGQFSTFLIPKTCVGKRAILVPLT